MKVNALPSRQRAVDDLDVDHWIRELRCDIADGLQVAARPGRNRTNHVDSGLQDASLQPRAETDRAVRSTLANLLNDELK